MYSIADFFVGIALLYLFYHQGRLQIDAFQNNDENQDATSMEILLSSTENSDNYKLMMMSMVPA